MELHSLKVLEAVLSAAGYHFAVRTDGWTECLVQRQGERWIGGGHTESEAFEDALEKMFPSRLAR